MIPARPVIFGLLTFLRPPSRFYCRPIETASARYCYSGFMRHLVKVHAATGRAPLGRIAELGPGGSLGTGRGDERLASVRYERRFQCDRLAALTIVDRTVRLLQRIEGDAERGGNNHQRADDLDQYRLQNGNPRL